MSGKIHFVTPTNRWVGSIPLSTIDPLTLEPLSTYVRPDQPNAPEANRPYHSGNEEGGSDHNIDPQTTREQDCAGVNEDDESCTDRTTNVAGQPVSLILARLQTTPRGCSCGCTVPAPPKHSDYYHAQHLLRLVFLTQRIRAKALRQCLPQYFDSPHHGEQQQQQQQQQQEHTVISIDDDPHPRNEPSASPRHDPSSDKGIAQPPSTPRYVHSLIQNRAFRNPLTNTEVEGDPTFYVVLEPGKGGWWYEPWAMAPTSSSPSASHPAKSHTPSQPDPGTHSHPPQAHPHPDNLAQCQQRQHNEAGVEPLSAPTLSTPPMPAVESEKTGTMAPPAKSPETIQYEKEQRKERWRQERTISLEVEAQHELEWRRWQRSLLPSRSSGMNATPSPATPGQTRRSPCRNMRLRLGKDVALLEPSERGLLLPNRLSKRFTEKQPVVIDATTNATEGNTADTILPVHAPVQIQASAPLEPMELEEIHQQNATRKQGLSAHIAVKHDGNDDCEPKPRNRAACGGDPGSVPAPFLPWWDPDPHPFKMPITQLSEFAISTLPEPVARHFGGISIYGGSTAKESQDAHKSKSSTMDDDTTHKENTAALLNCNMDGCKWVPVPHGDRVAVMIGTSKDFLLFPSFQRLMFRHLSREDFEDRVPRFSVLPRPLSMLMMEGRRAQERGYRAGRRGGGGEEEGSGTGTSRNPREQSMAQTQPAHFADSDERRPEQELADEQRASPSHSGRETRSWISRVLGRPTAAVSDTTTEGTTVRRVPETIDEPVAREAPRPLNLPAEDAGSAPLDTMDEKGQDASSSVAQNEKTMPPQSNLQRNDEERIKGASTRWKLYWETFEREDYDSSEYDYGSLDDESALEAHLHEDSSDMSSHSEDSSEEDEDAQGGDGSRSRGSSFGSARGPRQGRGGWQTVRGWMVKILSCGTRSIETRNAGSSELQQRRRQRAQRRRARRENRWLEQQRQYQEQQSLMMHRRLPLRLQRVLGPRGVLRLSQVGEFCRFYLTILVAVTLMGAIVYAAVNVEGSRDLGRHDHRPAQAPSSPAAVAVAVATSSSSSSSSSRAVGGGSTRGRGHDRGDQDRVEEFPGPGRLFRAQRSK
ncbi:hypothetical protein BGZ70_009274 [Mortierella alpina]|uniref:Uncharacterized protein n=1 Tax=Mortierella alpina TaxID=64518 RepID=A0A9P6JD69_MORAP|nr:hypothetical protein BGZ70_009274 [Mortierella alpina]